jgi:transposase
MVWGGLTIQEWQAMRVQFPQPQVSPRGGRPPLDDRRCLRVFSGCSGPAPNGARCHGGMAAPAPAGADSRSGKRPACCSASGEPSWPSSMTISSCAGMNALPMAASFLRKNGGEGRENQAAQGHEVDGSGRWPGTPLGAYLEAASPAEVTLLEQTLDTVALRRPGKPGRPRKRAGRLSADRGYDCHPLRARLARRGIEPTIPARRNHKNATHQDGRKLWCYRLRWIIERTFAWLGHCRRLVVRYERLITTYAGFVHLARALLTLRKVFK